MGAGIQGGAARRLALGFIAGAVAVLVFHQLTIGLVTLLRGGTPNLYNMAPTGPLRIPQIVNAMFWGGVWGVVYAAIVDRLPAWPAWAKGLLFGAVGPVLVGWFIVAPLKGQPMAAGWDIGRMVFSPIINGAFGLGVGVFFSVLAKKFARP